MSPKTLLCPHCKGTGSIIRERVDPPRTSAIDKNWELTPHEELTALRPVPKISARATRVDIFKEDDTPASTYLPPVKPALRLKYLLPLVCLCSLAVGVVLAVVGMRYHEHFERLRLSVVQGLHHVRR